MLGFARRSIGIVGVQWRIKMRMIAARRFLFAAGLLFVLAVQVCSAAGGPYQAAGIKIGEVSDNSAIAWTRLTRNAERNSSDWPKANRP